ncbi:MAG: nucleoside deaminase [Candidatus Bipolaricaulota bacterium]|nr:MAG: nucleoside deaminase [Candidatus Bipolaricaulota bacterium]
MLLARQGFASTVIMILDSWQFQGGGMDDIDFVAEALKEAEEAAARGECPVGAVIVREGEIIARSGNRVVELKDPTAHAEIVALREAGEALGVWNFPDCTVYSSLEPCPMCENAMLQAEVPKVVYGGSAFPIALEKRFSLANLERVGPIMQECRVPVADWLRRIGRVDVLEDEGI